MSATHESEDVRTQPRLSDQELRFEKKFVCDRHSAQDVHAIITLHPAGFRHVHPPRQINNVYLDSEDFSCYQDHGIEVVHLALRERLPA